MHSYVQCWLADVECIAAVTYSVDEPRFGVIGVPHFMLVTWFVSTYDVRDVYIRCPRCIHTMSEMHTYDVRDLYIRCTRIVHTTFEVCSYDVRELHIRCSRFVRTIYEICTYDVRELYIGKNCRINSQKWYSSIRCIR